MIVVPDAGPLIYIAGSGHIELLRALYVQVVVPRVVFEEVTAEGEGLVGAAEVRAATWISIDEGEPDPALLAVLDRGEAAAIPLAERLGATLLADDAAAREIARTRGLHVIGTLGVLLAAKKKDLIAEVAPVIALMETLGMFVSERLRAEVRRLAGE